MTEAYSIRRLTPTDWQEFTVIRLESLQQYPQFFGSTYAEEAAYTQENWQNWLARKNGCLFALSHNKQTIGITGAVTLRTDPTGSTGLLIGSYIKPEHQGKGQSEKLYKARIDWAIAYSPWKKLVVSHREGNEPSRRANQKWRFTFTHNESKSWPDGQIEDQVWYELDLAKLRERA